MDEEIANTMENALGSSGSETQLLRAMQQKRSASISEEKLFQ